MGILSSVSSAIFKQFEISKLSEIYMTIAGLPVKKEFLQFSSENGRM